MIQKIENKLIEDLFQFAQKGIMTPANLGIIKSGNKEKLFGALDSINTNRLVHLGTREKYDNWFDDTVNPFHKNLLPLYRDNLTVSEHIPFSYSARLLSHYLRNLCVRTLLYGYKSSVFIKIQHPIMTNTFLKTLSASDISRVNQIEGKNMYYRIVKKYRKTIDQKISAKDEALLKLKFCEDF